MHPFIAANNAETICANFFFWALIGVGATQAGSVHAQLRWWAGSVSWAPREASDGATANWSTIFKCKVGKT